MKLTKRVISFLLVAVMIFNSIPAGHASAGELSINGSLAGAVTDMEYGWDGDTYRFAEDVLSGVQDGHEVYLVADVETSNTLEAGNTVTMELSNFRLEGANAEDYLLPGLEEMLPFEAKIQILPKPIVIRPAKTYMYYGQNKPANDRLTELADYSNQLVGEDDVQISCTFKIQFDNSSEVGTYDIGVQGKVEVRGDDASNYEVSVAENLTYEIRAYETNAEAVTEENFDGNYDGKASATLYAPEKFLISATGGTGKNEWADSLEIKLEQTQDGSFTYYLRNNNSKDSEYYRAICAKTHRYSSVPTPEVTGIKVELADASEEETSANDPKILFLENGVFANRNVQVTVYVKGSAFAQDTTIYLGEQLPVTVPAAEAVEEDGIYTYEATFALESEDGKTVTYSLDAYAEDAIGKGEHYAVSDPDATYQGSKTKVTNALVLDREPPKVTIDVIDGNYNTFWLYAEFSIVEDGVGVKTVKYKWDSRSYSDYTEYSPNQTDYSLQSSWYDASIVQDSRHTLYLYVVDELGNVTEVSKKDINGTDSLSPVIDSIEIKTESGETVAYGAGAFFSNETVQIIIKAHDAQGTDDSPSAVTEVQKVLVGYDEAKNEKNYGKAVWNDALSAYVLTVKPNCKMTNIKIHVIDGAELTAEASLTDMIEGAESNDLYVEAEMPSISFNLGDLGHNDSETIYLGSDAADRSLMVAVADGPNDVYSGLAEVTIEFGNTMHATYVERTQSNKLYIPVASLPEGANTVKVTVVDHCGNSHTDSVSFIKDTEAPKASEDAEISVVTEATMIDGVHWFDDGETVTFRVGTIDGVTELAQIKLSINGENYTYRYKDISKDEKGYYVNIDTSDIKLSEQNTYTIAATISDMGWNSCELVPVTVHVDKVAPSIQRITVQKSGENAIEKVLRLLTFGIFANDDLTLRVYAEDPAYDSGLDYATIRGGAEEPEVRMNWDEEKGCFWYEVPAKEKALVEGTLSFVVYDKFGKTDEAHPIIQEESESSEDGEDIDKTDSFYVMIETELPWLGFELPAGDGFTRTDDQVWYNSNKDLSLSVHDAKSGIYNISFTINGETVTQDKLENVLISKPEERLTDAFTYYFDTDGLIEIAGKAENGQYDIEIVVTDNSGNESICTKTFFVDEIMPQIDKITFTPATVDGIAETTEFVEGFEYGFFFNQDFTTTVHVSDASPSSGLYAVKYRLVSYEGGVQKNEINGMKRIEDGTVTIEAPAGFVGQLFVEALDYVNNSSGEKTTKGYVTDSTAPTISITKNLQTDFRDAEGNPLYTQANSFTVVVSDFTAGLEQISYSKTAEQFPMDELRINVGDQMYQLGDLLEDGWEVVSVDRNLVTQIRKTFEFPADDNNIAMQFNAMDRSHNRAETVSSEVFTVDTIAPVIRVVFREDNDDDLYYNQNRVADIYVTERNFDPALINVLISNTFGAVPGYAFSSVSLTEHTAVIDFGEGDYTFDLNGKDLSGRDAEVSFSGGNEKLFYVDKTAPAIVENFAEFANNAENSFNADKVATITITEHNFDPDLVNLRITKKAAGAEHSHDGMVDVTAEFMAGKSWSKNGDTYSIAFAFSQDAVYHIQIAPVDLASNEGGLRSAVVFEIDKTVPVVSAKNGEATSADDTQFLDIYTYERKDSPVPTVTFADENISHIEYILTTYIPAYLEDGLVSIEPVVTRGTVSGNQFALEDFSADGIYAVELVAVDVAGNRSAVNANTYARMVHQDVLAFILDSSSAEGTGLYSLEYENGDAISKTPDDFKNLRIFVVAPMGTDIDIVLRDTNGNDIRTESRVTTDESIYGIGVSIYEIDEAFFRENFSEDTDKEMHLTVRNGAYRIDLAKIHIDSIAPACVIPEELTSWRWFLGEEDRTFTITEISELLEEADCKVYDNGKLIPFVYSAEEDTITFTLAKGWHNVGIILCDAAGNANINQEIVNIHIGYFWIILLSFAVAAIAAAFAIAFVYKRKRTRNEMMEET